MHRVNLSDRTHVFALFRFSIHLSHTMLFVVFVVLVPLCPSRDLSSSLLHSCPRASKDSPSREGKGPLVRGPDRLAAPLAAAEGVEIVPWIVGA